MAEDTRVQYTKNVLKSSLFKLLKKKAIDRITVKELCETAGINRGTFYLHYSCPRDLLTEVESNILHEKANEFFQSWDFYPTGNPSMPNMLQFFQDDRDVMQVLLASNSNSDFFNSVQELVRPKCLELWKVEFPDISQKNLEFIFGFLFSGARQLIADWAEHPDKISTDELAKRLETLGHHCLLAAKEF